MSDISRNIRYNTDIRYLMFHQSEHFYHVSGEDINRAAVQEGLFGVSQDIVINTNGSYDLSSRWIRGSTPLQYEKNIPRHRIFKYTAHDVSDSCDQQQMNFQAMHVLLVGNFDDDVPTIAQQEAVRNIVREAVARLPNLVDILFHSDVVGTSCPGVRMAPSKIELRRLFDALRASAEHVLYEPQPVVTPVLHIQSSTPTYIELQWSTIDASTLYTVYRKRHGTDEAVVAYGATLSPTYTDYVVDSNTTYTYQVSAALPVLGEGPLSNPATTTTPV